jgi:hypothetical protein
MDNICNPYPLYIDCMQVILKLLVDSITFTCNALLFIVSYVISLNTSFDLFSITSATLSNNSTFSSFFILLNPFNPLNVVFISSLLNQHNFIFLPIHRNFFNYHTFTIIILTLSQLISNKSLLF